MTKLQFSDIITLRFNFDFVKDYYIFRKIYPFTKVISCIAYQSDAAFCFEKPYAYTSGISIIYYSVFDSKSKYKITDIAARSIDISVILWEIINKLKS